MAILVDPDDLSQGASTTVTDMVFGTPTGNAVTLTSAGANLPALSDDMFFEIRDHSETVNNGLYEVDDASPTTSEVDVLKVTGSNPVAATSESCDTLGNTTTEKSILTILRRGRSICSSREILMLMARPGSACIRAL